VKRDTTKSASATLNPGEQINKAINNDLHAAKAIDRQMGFALHLQVVFRGGEVLKTCSNNLMFLEPSWRNMSDKVYPINVPLLTLQLLKRRARKRDTYGSEYSYSTHYERMPVTRTQSRKDGECK